MKIRHALVLLAVIFLLGLIVLMPATLIQAPVNRAMAPNAALVVTAGTIWSGTAKLTLFPAARPVMVPITWRFDPMAFLRLRLGFYLRADSAALAGTTRIGAGIRTIELRDTNLKIDSALINRTHSLLPMFGSRGTLHLTINEGDHIVMPYQATDGLRTAEGKLAAKLRAEPAGNHLQHHHIGVVGVEHWRHAAAHRLSSSAMASARSRGLPPRTASTSTSSS